MFTHTQFRELISRVAPDLSPPESLAVRAVAWHETNYGAGWKGDGEGSRNLGAITRQALVKHEDGTVECGPNGFAAGDSRNENGKVVQYQTCFARYPTFEDAARDLVSEVLKPNVRAEANKRTLPGVAAAMRANNYYLGTAPTRDAQVDAYFQALRAAVAAITKETHEPNPFDSAARDTLPPSQSPLSPSPSSQAPSLAKASVSAEPPMPSTGKGVLGIGGIVERPGGPPFVGAPRPEARGPRPAGGPRVITPGTPDFARYLRDRQRTHKVKR